MLKVSIAKTVLSRSSWTTQTCASHQACCEAAVHAVNQIIKSEDTKAALLVDTSNAFNTLNRQAALHNIQVTCPAISTIVKNAHQVRVQMFLARWEKKLHL